MRILGLVLFIASLGIAQQSPIGIVPTATSPTGAPCNSKTASMYYNYVNGTYYGCENGAYALIVGAATAVPGGSNTQVQFNDGGIFGGNTGFTFDKSTGTVSIGATVTIVNPTTVATPAAPTSVTPHGGSGSNWSYGIVVFNTIGNTPQSALTDGTNGTNAPDNTNYWIIPFPTLSGFDCGIYRNTNGDDPGSLGNGVLLDDSGEVNIHACDGSNFHDVGYSSVAGWYFEDPTSGIPLTGTTKGVSSDERFSASSFGFGSSVLGSAGSGIALGRYALASGQGAVSAGEFSVADALGAIAIGQGTPARGAFSIAIGGAAEADSDTSLAIGQGALVRAGAPGAVSIGWQVTNSVENTVNIGTNGTSYLKLTPTSGSANKAMCWKSDAKTSGFCSDVVGSDGSCTCN